MQLTLRTKAYHQLGAAAVEYGLTLAAVVTLVMGGARLMESPLTQAFRCSAEKIMVALNGGESSCGGIEFEIVTEISEGGEIYIAPPNPTKEEYIGATETSEKGVDFLKDIETLRLKPYDDQTGKDLNVYKEGATIGYGHLIKSKEEFEKYKNGITQEEAEQLFTDELYEVGESVVNKHIHVELEPHEYDALVMLAYNLGEGNFKNSSVAKIINGEPGSSYPTLEEAWMAYKISQGKVSQGLINRRRAEYEIYTTGVYTRW